MKILAVDSSSKAASVAITEDDRLLGEVFLNVGLTHSQTLMPMIKNLLKSTEVNLESIDVFAVTTGPGSFTGVRIGVASVKGMALPNAIPCFAVSTLHALAYNLLDFEGSIICAVMDARCEQVYNAIFEIKNHSVIRLIPDRAISIKNLFKELQKLKKNVIFVGDGAVLCYNKIDEYDLKISVAQENIRYQRASSVAFVAYNELIKGENLVEASNLVPMYLRLPQAERELKKKIK